MERQCFAADAKAHPGFVKAQQDLKLETKVMTDREKTLLQEPSGDLRASLSSRNTFARRSGNDGLMESMEP